MTITRFLLAGSAVLLLGCPATTGLPPAKTAATVSAADLPGDVPGLVKYMDQELTKRSRVGMENVLVAVDKASALDPKSFDVAARGAKACGFLTEEFPNDKAARGRYADRGAAYARVAQAADASRVEGHYWLGINLGQLATTKTNGAELVPKVLEAAKEATKLDEKYDFAGPLRLLGSLYAKAPEPPVSVGDREEGVRNLERAVELYPGYPQNVLHLGDALLANDKLADAERRYNQVLNAQPDPLWAARLDAWKKQARDGLRSVAKKRDNLNSGGSSPF